MRTPPSAHRVLEGWGRYPRSESRLYRPARISALEASLGSADRLIPRGLGRSYGDASFNAGGATVDVTRLDRFLGFDEETGVLECEAGVTVDDVLSTFVPRGFFPPVTPGTRFVTLGGCVACDVHGKNHHKAGSISRHVIDLTLLAPDGSTVRASRRENPALFWATVGGMGLTGCIVSLRVRLRRIQTAYLLVDHERVAGLDEAVARLDESDERYEYSVAWIDCLSRGDRLGRSVLMRGNPAPLDALPPAKREAPLRVDGGRSLSLPMECPDFVLDGRLVRLFNALYYRRFPRRSDTSLVHFQSYFYPLDHVRHWNRLYGASGLVQYQCVLPPDGARTGLAEILGRVSERGGGSFLAVLKQFGPGVEGGPSLSFPIPGYTLALDFPRGDDRLDAFLEQLDGVVADRGGRVYLAKDARLSPDTFRRMYPELPGWMSVKRRVDPDGRFESDLARRLELVR